MASHRDHINKAQHNEELLNAPRSLADHSDWAMTVAFYAAVHWIRALLSLNGIGAGAKDDVHYDEFARHLRDIGRVKQIDVAPLVSEFADLKGLARQARYYCQPKSFYDQHVHEAEAALKAVRAFVTQNGVVV